MGLDFLKVHGANRVANYPSQPMLLVNSPDDQDEEKEVKVKLDYEVAVDSWEPKRIAFSGNSAQALTNWQYTVRRFVDGKDSGRIVAWLKNTEGFPVPIRLSQIGAVVMRLHKGELRREQNPQVEQIVTFAADLFPWDEIEEFAIGLRRHGFRLVACKRPEPDIINDFEKMRKLTEDCSRSEMLQLEKLALAQYQDVPTLVDGRLAQKAGAFDAIHSPVVGVIKKHYVSYLHQQGFQTSYSLKPGERTPAFKQFGRTSDPDVITWLLRIGGDYRNQMPSWGVVRLEIPAAYFENHQNQDFSYIDKLSQLVWDYRCRDQTYDRASVSLHPIQRAEESLGSCFMPNEMLISRFYRITEL